ncbi:SCO family protein [Bizionia gelidisalsuginis]|uniref:SCO family protein n=1 Tax=Bizionia gelidisalsuginis TaxID=291188 RepID=A0ABY3M8S6_9FLAO|nr:SCO family protein [Bizionia gelidisalsuginis]TYC10662.1 SCO family protein [Bizionia gelidisalsuginis]
MKLLKYSILLIITFIAFQSCKSEKKEAIVMVTDYQCPMLCEGEKTYDTEGSCPVCKMDLKMINDGSEKVLSQNNEISEASIFNLSSTWHNEEGEALQLRSLKGKTLVMVMIYTSCKAACPRLVADMRNIEAEIPKDKLKNIEFVLISIDPKIDTPQRLKSFAIENEMDDRQWTFLQGTVSGVREFANVLSVKYKEISPIDFSHSNIISVFNAEGELIHQQEGLGVNNKETISSILKVTP